MTRSSPRNRGTALIAVIAMFVLIATAIASLSILFATENRRTLATTSESQLHQLLLASTLFATEDLRQHGVTNREVPMLTPVSSATVTLTFASMSENKVQIRARAKLSKASASQILTYARNVGEAWRLESAVLGNEP